MIAVLLLCAAASAPVHEPAAQAEQHPGQAQQGSSAAPLYIKVVPAAEAEADARDEREDRKRSIAANWWMVGLTVVLAAIALIQAVVTGITLSGLKHARLAAEAADKAADAALRGAEISADTAKKQLRAYIRIDSCTITDLAVGKVPEVLVEFTNCGQTPANEVISWMNVSIGPNLKGFGLRRPDSLEGYSKAALFPDDQKSMHMPTEAWTTSDAQAFATGKSRIVVSGEITYTDIWGEPHLTRFCQVHDNTRRPGVFGTHWEHNEAT